MNMSAVLFPHTYYAVSLAAGHLLKKLLLRIRQILSGYGCFDEYCVTFYGTPSLAEVEAIVLRIITDD